MIFKQLFRSKHQNPDPQIRLQAIQKLNEQDPQNKTVLHELAFNDSDPGVSLAALEKLDNFVLWYKMSQMAKNERVQKKSKLFVENALLDQKSDVLSATDKRNFIIETQDKSLIEKLLAQSWIQQDTQLAFDLLQKVDKPLLQEKILFETNNVALQNAILDTLNDSPQARKLLNKILKKAALGELQDKANTMLQTWLEAQQAPIEVENQVTMVLSRLLALKDQNDYLLLQQQYTELSEQYSQIASRFECLNELKRAEIQQKHQDICKRVENNLAGLKPQWQAQQVAVELQQKTDGLLADVQQSLAQQAKQLATRISDISASEVQEFEKTLQLHIEQLQSLTKQLPTSNKTAHKQLEQLHNQLITNVNTLNNLPELQQAIQQGQTLLATVAELALPNDASQIAAAEEYIYEQKQTWRDLSADYQAHFPADLVKQWRATIANWQQAIKTLKSELNNEVSRCRNKMKAVDSLISQGKFKAAMGLYQKVLNWFNALPEKQQAQLERSFSSVKEKIENLQDWQDYIATPRKPVLLAEVDALIAQPLEINAQSAAVKSLRSQWNSLGKTNTESDEALNNAFETAIEQAFAPCREHYDQQQLMREKNMLAKQQVLAELQTLTTEQNNTAELAKSVRKIQQKWRAIGEVDFKQRNELFDSYQQLLTPLKDKISAFYEDNAEQKQALLTKAERLLEMESVSEAIDLAKKLQQSWKTIEHAGKKAEANLWPAFRKANDSLFAKKAQQEQQQQSEFQAQLTEVKQLVTQLETSLNAATDKTSVQQALQDKQQVHDAVLALPVKDQRTLQQRVQKLVEQRQQKLNELQKTAQGQAYLNLFAALKLWKTNDQIPAEVAELNKSWQQCFKGLNSDVKRDELTIKMEIIAQQASPKRDAEKRQAIQMQMMAQKLQSGDNQDLTALLKEWITAGALNKSDISLLKRIEPLFVG